MAVKAFSRNLLATAIFSGFLTLSACGGGGETNTPAPVPPTPTPTPAPTPEPTPEPSLPGETFATVDNTARFLTQATFGPTPDDLEALTGTNASDWLLAEFAKPASLNMPIIEEYQQLVEERFLNEFNSSTSTFAFWRNAIEGDDQLRQRMAFALSQIMVVSNGGGELLTDFVEPVGYYMDILTQNAFGNYRDLLEAVTYSPAMGYYLTYMGNLKGDPETGRMPDENYAREILQLFTIGLLALNMDGSVQSDENGPIELYDNTDITGLAKVFTGLDVNYGPDPINDIDDLDARVFAQPMIVYPTNHSELEKSFLGLTIPPNTDAQTSIDMALDHIMSQPSVAPFIGRQLIQRFVTSHPEPDYIERVATAFESGLYTLPNGALVGEGRKGDLQATIAAVLFDPDARENPDIDSTQFGKIREPVVRFINWARAFEVGDITPEYMLILWDTSFSASLNQHPYRSASVFNFYRPGYVAPGTQTGALALTMPELQIMNATSTPGYANFMSYLVNAGPAQEDLLDLEELFEGAEVALDADGLRESFLPNYDDQLAMAENATELIDNLDLLLTYGNLSDETRDDVIGVIEAIPFDGEFDDVSGAWLRVTIAIIMIMNSADYLVQQ